MCASIASSGCAIVNQWAGGAAVHDGARRFVHNPNVRLDELIDEVKAKPMVEQQAGDHILILQDTSELNYSHLNGSLKVSDPDIGPISDNKSAGFMLHPGLAVHADTGVPMGISSVHIWNRRFGAHKTKNNEHQNRPIEQKESYKWIITAKQSKAWLAPHSRMTLVGDRENDVFEYFAEVPDERTDLVVRSSRNKRLVNGLLLNDQLEATPWRAKIELKIEGTQKRKQRTAILQLRWISIALPKPQKREKFLNHYPEAVGLNVVEICEHPDSVPPGEEPIRWCLYTTHEVENIDQALLIVKWYKWRWFIEDFFRTLKTKGLQIEQSQFKKGIALKKLVVLCLNEALKIMVMRQERQASAEHPISIVFDSAQQDFLAFLNEEMQGKTQKQKNPHPPKTLAWAVWIIALLGGWSVRDLNKRPAGVVTLSRGLVHFYQRFSGWEMAVRQFQQITNNSE